MNLDEYNFINECNNFSTDYFSLYQSQDNSMTFYSQLQISSREQKELEIKSKLIFYCENFINQVLEKLKNNELIEIYILDLDKNSSFDYNLGFYVLNICVNEGNFQSWPCSGSQSNNGAETESDKVSCAMSGVASGSGRGSVVGSGKREKIKYLVYNIYDHPEKLAKIFKIISIIHSKSLKNTSTTKRELYYNDVDLFKNTICIDNILHDVCSLFNVSRFDLSVFAAQKGLFAGDIIIYDMEGNMLNNSKSFDKINLISYEYYLEDIIIESTAEFILILEKESLFFNIITSKIYQENFSNSLIITGKGFPDYMTKYFIKKISNNSILSTLPIFYFGDFDPSGLEIFFNYLFGSIGSARENELMAVNNINWIGLSYENIINLQLQESFDNISLLKLDDKELKKIGSILTREYFNLKSWEISSNPFKFIIINNLQNIYNQFQKMREFEFKAEGEVVVSKYMEYFVDYLKFVLYN